MFMTQTIGQVELEYVALSEQNQYLVVRTLEKTQSSSNVFYHQFIRVFKETIVDVVQRSVKLARLMSLNKKS